jgi:predicted RNase H-like HicB family nuclease
MGYEVEEKAFRLKFEERPGLEVTAGSLELGDFLKVTQLAGATAEEAAKNAEELFQMFADAIIDWNLTKKGRPIPQTMEGIKTLYFDFALEMVMAWVQAMGGVDSPLKKDSGNGGITLESMMPMSPPS